MNSGLQILMFVDLLVVAVDVTKYAVMFSLPFFIFFTLRGPFIDDPVNVMFF